MSWIKEEFGFHDLQRLLFKLADRVKVFQGLTPAEISEILAKAEKCTYEAAAPIIREGSVGLHMYLIIDGEVVVTKQGRDGDVELARLGPADSFGEMALADNEVRSANVTAASPCVLVRIGEQTLRGHPAIGLKIYRNMAHLLSLRLRQADEQLAWHL